VAPRRWRRELAHPAGQADSRSSSIAPLVQRSPAMVYPTPTAKRGHTFMLFAYPTGVQGNVVNAGTNELILPNYKQTWANIRRLAGAPDGVKHLSFKVQEYKAS
jgi:hypothetical protein